MADENRIEHGGESCVEGTKLEICEGVFKMRHASAGKLVAELVPGLLRGGIKGVPVEQHARLIRMEGERETTSDEISGADEILEAGQRICAGKDGVGRVV